MKDQAEIVIIGGNGPFYFDRDRFTGVITGRDMQNKSVAIDTFGCARFICSSGADGGPVPGDGCCRAWRYGTFSRVRGAHR